MSFEKSHSLWTPATETHERLLSEGAPEHIVVSGPMGGGKRSTQEAVLEWTQPYDLARYGIKRLFSVSLTSRHERDELGEVDGVEYWFNIPPEKFEIMLNEGGLLEHVRHPGGWYATPMPEPDTPMLYEIEVTGVHKALSNPNQRADGFRRSHAALYIAQENMAQLLAQIMGRQDGMSEAKKIERASRYPGEMLYILDNHLPYIFIENKFGDLNGTKTTAIRAIAGDPEFQSLDLTTIRSRIEEACDHLTDQGIAPLLEFA